MTQQQPISPLRRRMIEDMTVRNLSPSSCSRRGGQQPRPARRASPWLGCLFFCRSVLPSRLAAIAATGSMSSAAMTSQALSLEREAVDCVDEPVEDGVGDRRVGDDVVPVVDGKLAGDDGAATAVAVVDDLEDVATLLGGHARQAPVVEDQQLDARKVLQEAYVAPVTACERQHIE